MIKIFAFNTISNSTIYIPVQVQTSIVGFKITYPTKFNYYPAGSSYYVAFNAISGTHFVFNFQVDGNTLIGLDTWNENTTTGNITIPWSSLDGSAGVKNLTITVGNAVTNYITVFYICQFEYNFANFTNYSPSYLATGSISTLNFTWMYASHFNYTLDLGNGVSVNSSMANTVIDPARPTMLNYTPFKYSAIGVYVITITAVNHVDSETYTFNVTVENALSNVAFDMLRFNPYIGLELNNYYLLTNETAQFAVTLDEGTNYKMTMNFSDNTSYIKSSLNATAMYYNHSFAQAGNYSPSVTVKNILQSQSLYLPIPSEFPQYLIVEDPIACFKYNLLPANVFQIAYSQQSVGTNLTLQIYTDPNCGTMIGTNPRYIIDWGDQTAKTSGSMGQYNQTGYENYDISQVHTYSKSDVYVMNLTIWNEVSRMTFIQNITVMQECKLNTGDTSLLLTTNITGNFSVNVYYGKLSN